MSRDLEEQLGEMGPGYQALVGRLRAARTVVPRAVSPLERLKTREPFFTFGRLGLLAAATLFIAIGFAILTQRNEAVSAVGTVYTVAYAPTEEALEAIVASQRADGSWENDFITCQNAAALRHGTDMGSRIAYKKAVRYLRAKGLAPLTDAELKARGEFAAERG